MRLICSLWLVSLTLKKCVLFVCILFISLLAVFIEMGANSSSRYHEYGWLIIFCRRRIHVLGADLSGKAVFPNLLPSECRPVFGLNVSLKCSLHASRVPECDMLRNQKASLGFMKLLTPTTPPSCPHSTARPVCLRCEKSIEPIHPPKPITRG